MVNLDRDPLHGPPNINGTIKTAAALYNGDVSLLAEVLHNDYHIPLIIAERIVNKGLVYRGTGRYSGRRALSREAEERVTQRLTNSEE